MCYYYYYTEYCQGIHGIDDSVCLHVSTDNASSCVLATLQCENKECSAVISGVSRICGFNNIGAGTVSQPIQCCYCNIRVGFVQSQFWDCENVTTPTLSQTMLSPSREFKNVSHTKLELSYCHRNHY